MREGKRRERRAKTIQTEIYESRKGATYNEDSTNTEVVACAMQLALMNQRPTEVVSNSLSPNEVVSTALGSRSRGIALVQDIYRQCLDGNGPKNTAKLSPCID